MALSIDSINKPIRDFFLEHFKSDPGSVVFFRFDKDGSFISDQDFIDPNFPGQYSVALAKEKFANIVNNIPVEDPDGLNIRFTENDIDGAYNDFLLNPALPFIPAGTDDVAKESIQNSFNAIHADAVKLWGEIKLESVSGNILSIKPSNALPVDWYDKTKNENWQSFSYKAEETTTAVNDKKTQIWKLKNDDDAVKKILEEKIIKKPAVIKVKDHRTIFLSHDLPLIIKTNPLFAKKETPKAVEGIHVAAVAQPVRGIRAVAARPLTRVVAAAPIAGAAVASPDIRPAQPQPVIAHTFLLQPFLKSAFFKLDFKKRLLANQLIKQDAPTKPVESKSVAINFDYCLVHIDRPWLKSTFLQSKDWYITNAPKGSLTSPDVSGGNITSLPIAFVAIKNLSIEADWSNEDIISSQNATDFGPFEVNSQIVDRKLSHQGIQIIGWLLQKMPELPPNDAV